MKVASIDIGTNTVLLLIASIDGSGVITPVVYEQRVARLGQGVDAARNLHPDAMERVLKALREFRQVVDAHAPDRTVVCGTSAVRDAANRDEFVALVRNATGFAVDILSGDEEALWTYRGAISGVPHLEHATVVDIGGGSTEIIVGNRTSIHESISLDVGSVRLTERVFRHDPPTHPELEKAIEIVENELARAGHFPFAGTTLVGVAGTATSLAVLDQGLAEFRLPAVSGYPLELERVYELFRKLRAMPVAGIRGLSAVMEGRADVITAGVLILREIMAHFTFQTMTVSERGVRYGLALREWERQMHENHFPP
jgi:exopolyphosphatase/guanosine-5'-triphosphate,3'-diphosphate pyrophosphatase